MTLPARTTANLLMFLCISSTVLNGCAATPAVSSAGDAQSVDAQSGDAGQAPDSANDAGQSPDPDAGPADAALGAETNPVDAGGDAPEPLDSIADSVDVGSPDPGSDADAGSAADAPTGDAGDAGDAADVPAAADVLPAGDAGVKEDSALADSTATDAIALDSSVVDQDSVDVTDASADPGPAVDAIVAADGSGDLANNSNDSADSATDAGQDTLGDAQADVPQATDGPQADAAVNADADQAPDLQDDSLADTGSDDLAAADTGSGDAVAAVDTGPVLPACALGAACDDANPCTVGESCDLAGACTGGTAKACDDGNPCTGDSCDSQLGCIFKPLGDATSCTNGSVCSLKSQCLGGVCVPTAVLSCDDANPCTTDGCDGSSGCFHNNSPAKTPCSDGNACTVNDGCNLGLCAPGSPVSCDDSNPCTLDSCDIISGCQHANLVAPCADDGNACTADICLAGACSHPALDGSPCPSDGNACTLDVCSGASCSHPSAEGLACADDGNSCTADLCAGSQCTHPSSNAGLACDDGNPCTSAELCVNGSCGGGIVKNCDDGLLCTQDSCNPNTGLCVHPTAPGCGPTYTEVYAQVFKPLCVGCHGPVQFTYNNLYNQPTGDPTYAKLVDPGNPNGSAVVMAIDVTLPLSWGQRMPKGNLPAMTPTLLKLVRDWISNGAVP